MVNIFRKIWSFSLKEKKNLEKSMIVGFLNAVFNAMLIGAMYVVLKGILENNVTSQTAWLSFIIMITSIIGKIVTQYFSQLQRTHAGYFMVADKRIQIGQKLKSVPMGYFNKNSLGQITAIETTILNDVENAVPVVLVITLGGFLNSLVFALFMVFFDWRLGIITLLGILLFLLVTSAMEKKSREGVPKRQEAQAVLVEKVLETIQGMSVVKAFNLVKDNKGINTAIENSCKRNTGLEKAMTPYVALQQLVLYVFSVALMFFSIRFYLNGTMELANSLIMVICSFMVYEQLKVAGSCVANMRIAEHSIDKANEIDQVPVMKEGTVHSTFKPEDITFENVDFAYEKKKILDNVSLTIPSNKMTAIVGPSGSGKTTLCSLIARFWDVDKGSINISGINVKDYTLSDLMSNISMVFQNVYLFADTIENNIKFGKKDATSEEVIEAAKKACCHDFIMSLPDGYDTVIGEGGASLSGGEKQRISIARALIKDAPIVIFDEATANVDPENEDRLQKAIEALTKDKTVIMIAHRLKTVRNADKIVVLNEGKIVQEGTHDQLIKEKGIYSDFIATRKETIGWKLGRK